MNQQLMRKSVKERISEPGKNHLGVLPGLISQDDRGHQEASIGSGQKLIGQWHGKIWALEVINFFITIFLINFTMYVYDDADYEYEVNYSIS